MILEHEMKCFLVLIISLLYSLDVKSFLMFH